jgi:ubiquinone/menaquinone biosynthesis C-methylase UbiE
VKSRSILVGRSARYFELLQEARHVYANGGNITEALRKKAGLAHNTTEIVEIAYDLQAGSYVEFAERNLPYVQKYTAQIAEYLNPHLFDNCTILDIGSGELTNLTYTLDKLIPSVRKVFAFDISWSRIDCGREFLKCRIERKAVDIEYFVADIVRIPLRTRSVDIVISNHALEPNGGRETELLSEIFRVARLKAVLFEPSYEINSAEGKRRMERLGYISGLRDAAAALGATLESFVPMPIIDTDLNTTACHVFIPEGAGEPAPCETDGFLSDPGQDTPIFGDGVSYYSPSLGVSYPIIDGIPILRMESAILTSRRRRVP